MKVLGSSAKTAYYYKKIQGLYPNWKIKYKLKCNSEYCTNKKEFDGWFQNIEAFQKQKNQGLISCPICGSEKVMKSLTAPNLKINNNKIIVENIIRIGSIFSIEELDSNR